MKMDLIPMVMKPQMGLLNWKQDFPMEDKGDSGLMNSACTAKRGGLDVMSD